MKTTIKSVFLFAATSLFSLLQTHAQIIDGGFENWDSVSVGEFRDYMPAGWMGVNNAQCESEGKPWAVTRSTDAHTGNFAIELKNVALSFSSPTMLMSATLDNGTFNNKIPVNARYKNLSGFYKYITNETDTFNITIIMMHGEDFIGMAEFKRSANSGSYVPFNIPIIYSAPASIVPDSAVIMFTAGSMEHFAAGSTLTLDDIAFGSSSGVNDQAQLSAAVTAWPNPSHGKFSVAVDGETTGTVNIEVLDITGRTLAHQRFTGNGKIEADIELGENEKGIYFVKVSDALAAKTIKVINQ